MTGVPHFHPCTSPVLPPSQLNKRLSATSGVRPPGGAPSTSLGGGVHREPPGRTLLLRANPRGAVLLDSPLRRGGLLCRPLHIVPGRIKQPLRGLASQLRAGWSPASERPSPGSRAPGRQRDAWLRPGARLGAQGEGRRAGRRPHAGQGGYQALWRKTRAGSLSKRLPNCGLFAPDSGLESAMIPEPEIPAAPSRENFLRATPPSGSAGSGREKRGRGEPVAGVWMASGGLARWREGGRRST